jgi:hypothetical protein
VRKRLHELADLHGIDELHTLADELVRRSPGRRVSGPVSKSMTPELAEAIRAYSVAYPDATLHEIGKVFSVNQGRVSESLFGKRA